MTKLSIQLVKYGASKDAFAFKDRKSTRLNSSHVGISYAVFGLKKKIRAVVQRVLVGVAAVALFRLVVAARVHGDGVRVAVVVADVKSGLLHAWGQILELVRASV